MTHFEKKQTELKAAQEEARKVAAEKAAEN